MVGTAKSGHFKEKEADRSEVPPLTMISVSQADVKVLQQTYKPSPLQVACNAEDDENNHGAEVFWRCSLQAY